MPANVSPAKRLLAVTPLTTLLSNKNVVTVLEDSTVELALRVRPSAVIKC
jgi:hypothetical protein